MATRKIHKERVQHLNGKSLRSGDYVLYWMQSSQRAEYNHALEYAVQRANDLGQRLLVVFGLTDDYPEANLRHYAFMLEGLKGMFRKPSLSAGSSWPSAGARRMRSRWRPARTPPLSSPIAATCARREGGVRGLPKRPAAS